VIWPDADVDVDADAAGRFRPPAVHICDLLSAICDLRASFGARQVLIGD
jgi:hypothetical protein